MPTSKYTPHRPTEMLSIPVPRVFHDARVEDLRKMKHSLGGEAEASQMV